MRKLTGLLIYNRRRYRVVKRWYINRNTPVGESADFYEIKPFDGKMYIAVPIAELYDDHSYQLITNFTMTNRIRIEYEAKLKELGYTKEHIYEI